MFEKCLIYCHVNIECAYTCICTDVTASSTFDFFCLNVIYG